MKRLIYHILCAVICASACHERFHEEDIPADIPQQYVNVGIRLVNSTDGTDTRSVVSTDVENFRRAILFAYDPASGTILKYGSNAGALSGTNIIKQSTASTFSWPLPTGKAMCIYCIINPPESLVSAAVNSAYNSERSLENAVFICNNTSSFISLESSDTGLPKSGILEVGADEFTEDNSALSIPVKNIFAKFNLAVDRTGIPDESGFRLTRVKVFAANTKVPYFSEDYRQTSASMLKDFDYATAEQLETLSAGGTLNGVILYTLENCQGNKAGATSWSSVREELEGSWSGINLCTRLLIEYELEGKVYAREIFLGSGDMKSDFNVRRNMYKSIVFRPAETTGARSPYFSFTEGTYYAHPGERFSASEGAFSTNLSNLSLAFSTSSGLPAGEYFSDVSILNGNIGFMVSPSTPLGEYSMTGGRMEEFFWDGFGTSVAPVSDRAKLLVTELQNMSLNLISSQDDIYPFLPAVYETDQVYPLEKAEALAASLRFTSLPENSIPSLTETRVVNSPLGYRIRVSVYPAHDGTMDAFTLAYGSEGRTCSGETLEVLKPDITVTGTREDGKIHVNVYGNQTTTVWRLCRRGSTTPLPSPEGSSLRFDAVKQDSYGTRLRTIVSSGSPNTSGSLELYLGGFSNLPGFSEDTYTFAGADFSIKGSFTYDNGYCVEKTVEGVTDNPLKDYSYDGKTLEYEVHQGRRSQGEFVSVTPEDYIPDNMLSWSPRRFNIDLTRGGNRECNGLEVWTEYSGIAVPAAFGNKNAPPGFSVIFYEDFSYWGPVYYGRKVRNSHSGEELSFVHSIIRIYNHYNVFATFDAKEKHCTRPDWDNLGNVSWNWSILGYYLGGFRATVANNFNLGPLREQLSSLVTNSISSSTRVLPILDGYSLCTDTSQGAAGHGRLSGGPHNEYQIYLKKSSSNFSYVMGYHIDGNTSYTIYYDWLYADGAEHDYTPVYWRLIAAANTPWFKITGGNASVGGKYISIVTKTGLGEYNFNIIPQGEQSIQSRYKDSQGRCYQYIHPFWEGKEGRFLINSRKLSPETSFNAELCLVNGWYNPSLYRNGVPVLKEKTGMYFFPESTSGPTRAGYPGYYPNDVPYSRTDLRNNMETGLDFGDLPSRD